MEVLTDRRAKPALPFAGVYRLIDLPLSSLRNSGIEDVWVVAQYEIQSVVDVIANGRPWDLDRTHGGFRIITPQQQGGDADGAGWHEGNADALFKTRHLVQQLDPDVLLVLSADHVYRLDYRDVVATHLEAEADATVVTTRVPRDQASHHGVVEAAGGRVTGFAYKPEEPASDLVATEVFAYRPEPLIATLEELAGDLAEGANLGDFGERLLPRLVERGRVHEHRLDGYWKDVGRPETYFAAHQDLLAERPGLDLDDPSWPVLTRDHQRLPARIRGGATVADALVSPGCDVAGTVRNAVLGPGVVVETGATVEHAVILADTVVRSGAQVRYAIVDAAATVGTDAVVGEPPAGAEPITDELVLIGTGAAVPDGERVPAGARVAATDERQDVTGR